MRLSIKRMGQRGVTLVELVIVLCLIAIISTSILGLILAIDGLVQNSKEAEHDIQELTYFRKFIEEWFYSYDEEKNQYEILGNKLYITEDGNIYTIDINEDIVTVGYDESKLNPSLTEYPYTNTFTFEGINSIKFECYEDTRLYKCIITYDEEETFDFILGRRS